MADNKLKYIFPGVNVLRSFIAPALTVLVSYCFISRDQQTELYDINKMIVAGNIVLVLTGWGMRDFLLKQYSANARNFERTWNTALASKLVLLLLALIISFIFLALTQALLLFPYILLRTINLHYDVMLVYYRRNIFLLIFEVILTAALLVFIYMGFIKTWIIYFIALIVYEMLRVILNVSVFGMIRKDHFQLNEIIPFLLGTKFFFLISLISFFQGKIDLYVVAFSLDKKSLNEYQVITGFISFSYIAIASFASPFSQLMYRNSLTAIRKFSAIVIVSGMAAALLSATVIYLLMNLFYGYSFSLPEAVLVLINITSFTFVLLEMYHYTNLNKVNVSTVFVFGSGILNFLLSMMIIKYWSVTGAIICNTVSSSLLAGAMYLYRNFFMKAKSSQAI